MHSWKISQTVYIWVLSMKMPLKGAFTSYACSVPHKIAILSTPCNDIFDIKRCFIVQNRLNFYWYAVFFPSLLCISRTYVIYSLHETVASVKLLLYNCDQRNIMLNDACSFWLFTLGATIFVFEMTHFSDVYSSTTKYENRKKNSIKRIFLTL